MLRVALKRLTRVCVNMRIAVVDRCLMMSAASLCVDYAESMTDSGDQKPAAATPADGKTPAVDSSAAASWFETPHRVEYLRPSPRQFEIVRFGLGHYIDPNLLHSPRAQELLLQTEARLFAAMEIGRLQREANKTAEEKQRDVRINQYVHAYDGYPSSDAESAAPTPDESKILDALPHAQCPVCGPPPCGTCGHHRNGPLRDRPAEQRWKMSMCGNYHYWWPTSPTVYTVEQVIERGWATAAGYLLPLKDHFLNGPPVPLPKSQ